MPANQLTKNFILQEWVPEETYRVWGDSSIMFIDMRIVKVVQKVRNHFGVTVVNNWHDQNLIQKMGYLYTESGYRLPNTLTGAFESQHKSGRAGDLKVLNVHSEEVRIWIRDNFAMLNKLGLTTIEADTEEWAHLDCRETNKKELFIVWPKKHAA